MKRYGWGWMILMWCFLIPAWVCIAMAFLCLDSKDLALGVAYAKTAIVLLLTASLIGMYNKWWRV